MPNFNLNMLNIFEKFNSKEFQVKSFEIQMKKLKFDSKEAYQNVGNKYKDQVVMTSEDENNKTTGL